MFRRLLSTLATRCSSCSRRLPTALPACSNCGSISPVPTSVPFHDLFALPARPNPFIIDPALLKLRFREAQAACHPDSWASKGRHKQDIAQGLSTRLNEAYTSLADPLKRAEYILEQNGFPISESDQLDDIEFISEIMQVRESIDEAEDTYELSSLVEENTGKIEETVSDLERAVGQEDWERVKAGAVRLKYLRGIEAAAREKEWE